MLSRIAESLFWIGRYVERADDQARVLTVNLEMSTEADSTSFGVELCRAMGAPLSDDPTARESWAVLGTDPASPQSMVTALSNCRDSARRAREIFTTSAWEAINRAHRTIASGTLTRLRPSLACRTVHDSCSMIIGSLTATMPRDEAWQFLNAGRYIERIDMTSRILYATVVAPSLPAHRLVMLQACGAQQAFAMSRGREDNLAAAVDFLLRDRWCPRSISYSINEAVRCLVAIDPMPLRAGFEDESQRLLGMLGSRIEYMRPDEGLEKLGELTHQLQETGAHATQALTARYFEGALSSHWHER
jgi:uncharacterized alpha-E superfamily protein